MTTTELRTPPIVSEDTDPDLHAALTDGAIAHLPDPYRFYARLRQDYPVLTVFDMVSVFRYDDVAAVLRHPRVSTDDRNSALHQSLRADGKLAPAYLSQLDDRSFLHRDPPEHTRVRKLAAKGFTPHRVAALRPFIQRHVDSVLDRGAGRLELVGDLAYPLPIAVISELLGIPDEDRAFVATWPRTQLCCTFESASANAALEVEKNSRQAEADRIQQQLTDHFTHLIDRRRIDHRRGHPGDDLVSALIAAEENGEQLTTDEINATLRLLFVAGYENAVNLIGHGMLALLRHPDQLAALCDHPTLAGAAVDEALRYDAPFQFTRRIALADLDIGGYHIPQGQTIIAWIDAANRDPQHFPNPDRFDIHRAAKGHLAFGAGIHACLGGPLARLQAEITFTTLAHRLVNPRLEIDPPTYRTDVFRSLEALPITATVRKGQ